MDNLTRQYIAEVAAELRGGDVDKAVRSALVLPPAAWDSLAAELTIKERDELARTLQSLCVSAARCGVYLEQRAGGGCGDQGHGSAVREQNKVAGRVRTALGFTRGRVDINF